MLITHGVSSLVVDKLCDQAGGQNAAVTCFCFDFADRKEQSATRALGSLLRQVVGGLERIRRKYHGHFERREMLLEDGDRDYRIS